jgi:hypothetical protein
MAEHGTPDQITSQAPFIQALVQKSVTAITKLAGRLSFGMLGESWATAQGGNVQKDGTKDGTKVAVGKFKLATDCTDFHGLIRLEYP